MNEVRLVKVNEQIRFLSKDFLSKGKKLIHGIEILSEYYEDKKFVEDINKDKKNRRSLLTFEEIKAAIEYVYPKESEKIMRELIKLITFDAIVGNNDRHFYNWGIIGNIETKNSGVSFSPIYDTARALMWNLTEEKINEVYDQTRTDKNMLKSFTLKSKPRFSFEDNNKANHFELVEYLLGYKENIYKQVILELISKESEENVILEMNKNLSSYFSKNRYSLIEKIIKIRFEKLRKLI